MINGISSYGSYMSYQQSQCLQQPRDPDGMFKRIDSDGSGGISQAELDAFAGKISEKTGNTIDTADTLSTYDADNSGELSGEELKNFLVATGMQPPMKGMGMMGMNRPDPSAMFNEIDSDGSGGISQTELETLAEKISAKTGTTMDTEDAVSIYDTDGDGELSSEELKNFMEASGMQPPREIIQQAMSAYSLNSGGEETASLVDYLTASEETYNPLSLIA